MNNKYFTLVVGTFGGLGFVLSLWLYLSATRIAYVRSNDLVSNFKGTIEAKQKFEAKRTQMLSNVDSLEFLYQRSKENYLQLKDRMSTPDRTSQEREIRMHEERLVQYKSVVHTKIDEEDAKMMEGVLSQVNSFIEEYAKANKYDLILGTTLSGNLLYAKKGMDITDVLLVELNLKYSGK